MSLGTPENSAIQNVSIIIIIIIITCTIDVFVSVKGRGGGDGGGGNNIVLKASFPVMWQKADFENQN